MAGEGERQKEERVCFKPQVASRLSRTMDAVRVCTADRRSNSTVHRLTTTVERADSTH